MARRQAIFWSTVNLVAGVAIYYHLVTGGWLTTHYTLSDPNIVNLLLAIFEAIAIVVVAAYWIWRTPSLGRLLVTFAVIQIVVGAAIASLILLFVLTWHPKLM